jgi:hypothetical protein
MSFLSNTDDALVARVFMPVSDALASRNIDRTRAAMWAYGAAVVLQLASTWLDLASGHGALFPVMGAVFTILLVAGVARRDGARRDRAAISLRIFVVVVTALGVPLAFATTVIEAALPSAGGFASDAVGAMAPTDLLSGLQALTLLGALYLHACADETDRP